MPEHAVRPQPQDVACASPGITAVNREEPLQQATYTLSKGFIVSILVASNLRQCRWTFFQVLVHRLRMPGARSRTRLSSSEKPQVKTGRWWPPTGFARVTGIQRLRGLDSKRDPRRCNGLGLHLVDFKKFDPGSPVGLRVARSSFAGIASVPLGGWMKAVVEGVPTPCPQEATDTKLPPKRPSLGDTDVIFNHDGRWAPVVPASRSQRSTIESSPRCLNPTRRVDPSPLFIHLSRSKIPSGLCPLYPQNRPRGASARQRETRFAICVGTDSERDSTPVIPPRH